MSIVTNALQSLIDAGNDAMNNLFSITLSGGDLGETGDLTIRASGFTPPMYTQDSYKVTFVTATIERPRTKVNLTRSFTLDFRVDDNWNVYKKLLRHQKNFMNAQKSYVNHDLEALKNDGKLFDVVVNRIINLDESGEASTEKLFKYNYCWISQITPTDFSSSSNEPIKVTATINFIEAEDWQSGIKNDATHGSKLSASVRNVL